jgi:hypothetical protein
MMWIADKVVRSAVRVGQRWPIRVDVMVKSECREEQGCDGWRMVMGCLTCGVKGSAASGVYDLGRSVDLI